MKNQLNNYKNNKIIKNNNLKNKNRYKKICKNKMSI